MIKKARDNETKQTIDKGKIYEQVFKAVEHLLQATDLTQGHVLVVGASTSEVLGKRIGTEGSTMVAEAIFKAVKEHALHHRFQMAFQCCEHLNRALVVEQAWQVQAGLERVAAVPVAHAGGALATYAYTAMEHPVLVESIAADAAIDIGETIIGMHLKPVAVPIRLPDAFVGQARVLLAATRPKFIGGARTVYQ